MIKMSPSIKLVNRQVFTVCKAYGGTRLEEVKSNNHMSFNMQSNDDQGLSPSKRA